ncbi:RNA polymerase sigma factor [bacterium]|nr:RNA polymerase sigma factor [bacterium]
MSKAQTAPQMAQEALPGPDDAGLVSAFVGGDEAAFSEIMTRYRRMVYFVALKFVGNHDDADEVTQKTFVSAYRNLAGFEGRSSLKTWLYRIAVNYSKNLVRDRKRREGEEVKDTMASYSPDPTEPMEQDEKRQQVAEMVETLPPRQKQVLKLRVGGELSFAQIAEILGCSVSAAKVNYHYAVKALRSRIDPTGA